MRITSPIFIVFVLLFLAVIGAFGQTKAAKSVTEIRDMLKRAESDDGKTSEAAREELSKLTADSIPNLFEIVKKDGPCAAGMAAGVITEMNPTYPELVPAITKIVRGAGAFSILHWEKDGLCRRLAAFLLPKRSILNLLRTGDTWEKQAAVFALDDFTEVAAYNDRPGEVEVMMDIVPALAKLQTSKDKVIKEMSSEVLTQISGEPPDKLANLAKKLVAY